MNIALIGAPGSGKTDLALQLAQHLAIPDDECGCTRHPRVIDGYVDEVEQKTQIAVGLTTSYLGNFYIALERYARERTARMENDTVITCGTLVETAIYMAMQFVALTEVLGPEAKEEAAPRIEAALRMMAVLYNDIVTYDYAFYLPVREASQESEFIDKQLQAGLEGFKLIPVTPLLNHETRVQDALAAMEVKSADN